VSVCVGTALYAMLAEEDLACEHAIVCMATRFCFPAERDLSAEPDIPLSACVDGELLFMPEDADVHILVSRADIVRSSFQAVMAIPAEAWSTCVTIDVCFVGETAYGEGVAREWLGALSKVDISI
jgi:hypothetical protein